MVLGEEDPKPSSARSDVSVASESQSSLVPLTDRDRRDFNFLRRQMGEPELPDDDAEAAKVLARVTREVRGGALLTRASTVQTSRPRWMWKHRLAFGKLCILDGDPGQGKSTLTLDLAARVSAGFPLPEQDPLPAMDVLLLSAEDGLADTIVPRLEAAGADLDRVVALEGMAFNGEQRRPWSLPGDIPHLRSAVIECGAKFIVIDPLMAFLGGQHDSYKDADVRRALHPLSDLAGETGACILVVRHLTKGGRSGKALYAGAGSIGIAGAARCVMLAADDPDTGMSALAVVKNNLGPKAPTLKYQLKTSTEWDCPVIQWRGISGHTADTLIQGGERDS